MLDASGCGALAMTLRAVVVSRCCAAGLALLAADAAVAGTLHACAAGGVTSYQAAPCGAGSREIRRIAFEPDPAPPATARSGPRISPGRASAASRAPTGRRAVREVVDPCEQARAARERVLGRNQQGGTYAQRQRAHEAVADACY